MKTSIITINYNNRDGLEKTLRSVSVQKDRDFQYIVVDGGSTDGSLDLIKSNSDIIDKWISEKDRGIYHAMNKGVDRADGEYCLFLNSGDILHSDDTMKRAQEALDGSDIVFGQVVNIRPDGKRQLYVPSEEMTLMLIIQTGIHHAGSFIKTSLMKKFPYDEKLKICSDRKFFVQALVIDNCSYRNLDFPVCDFELGGISYTNTDKAAAESWHIMEELFPPRLVADYRKTNYRIQCMTERLVKCRYKIIGLICGIDNFLMRVAKIILGSKATKKKDKRDKS